MGGQVGHHFAQVLALAEGLGPAAHLHRSEYLHPHVYSLLADVGAHSGLGVQRHAGLLRAGLLRRDVLCRAWSHLILLPSAGLHHRGHVVVDLGRSQQGGRSGNGLLVQAGLAHLQSLLDPSDLHGQPEGFERGDALGADNQAPAGAGHRTGGDHHHPAPRLGQPGQVFGDLAAGGGWRGHHAHRRSPVLDSVGLEAGGQGGADLIEGGAGRGGGAGQLLHQVLGVVDGAYVLQPGQGRRGTDHQYVHALGPGGADQLQGGAGDEGRHRPWVPLDRQCAEGFEVDQDRPLGRGPQTHQRWRDGTLVDAAPLQLVEVHVGLQAPHVAAVEDVEAGRRLRGRAGRQHLDTQLAGTHADQSRSLRRRCLPKAGDKGPEGGVYPLGGLIGGHRSQPPLQGLEGGIRARHRPAGATPRHLGAPAAVEAKHHAARGQQGKAHGCEASGPLPAALATRPGLAPPGPLSRLGGRRAGGSPQAVAEASADGGVRSGAHLPGQPRLGFRSRPLVEAINDCWFRRAGQSQRSSTRQTPGHRPVVPRHPSRPGGVSEVAVVTGKPCPSNLALRK